MMPESDQSLFVKGICSLSVSGAAAGDRGLSSSGGWNACVRTILVDPFFNRRRSTMISDIDWYRSSGSFSSDFFRMWSNSAGISSRYLEASSGSSFTMEYIIAASCSPRNGVFPCCHLKQYHAERKNIGTDIGFNSLDLFRRHVGAEYRWCWMFWSASTNPSTSPNQNPLL